MKYFLIFMVIIIAILLLLLVLCRWSWVNSNGIGIQAIATVVLVCITSFYAITTKDLAIKTKEMAEATRGMAEETKKMAIGVQFQRRQETIKSAILVALLKNAKSAEQIAKEAPFTLEGIKPVIGGLMGPMGLIQNVGKNQVGEQVYQ